MTRKKTDEEIQVWIKERENGASAAQIANKYNVSSMTVLKHLKNSGLEIGKKTDEQIQAWIKAYENGASYAQIAKDYKVSDITVRKYFRKNEIKIRINGADIPDKLPVWTALYLEGKSLSEIAKITKSRRHTVSKYLKLNEIEVKNAKEMSQIYQINASYFNVINTPEKAYWLGFLAADGNVYKSVNHRYKQIELSLKKQDVKQLEKFLLAINSNHLIKDREIKGSLYSRVKFACAEMFDDLQMWGIVPNKTDKLHIPRFENKELERYFILGLFDGDGSISIPKNNQQPIFRITGIKQGLEKAQELLMEHTGISKTELIPDKRSHAWSLSYGGSNQVRKIGEWLYKDNPSFVLKRKRNRFYRVKGLLAALSQREPFDKNSY